MKIKATILSLFMVFAGYAASAQMYGGTSSSESAAVAAPSYGVRAGVTFAKLSMSDEGVSVETDNLTGFQIGGFLNYPISTVFSIQPELLYTQKGGSLGSGSQTAEFRFNYLEVPVLGKFAFGQPSFQGFVTAGPVLGYWASGTVEEGGESYDIDFDEADANRLEAGLSLGGGVASGAFSLEVRYGLGLTSVFGEDSMDSRNKVVGLTIGYLFGR